MKKRIIVGILAALFLVSAVPAFAGISDGQQQEINKLFNQIGELRKQILDKYVDAGELTKEQGNAIKENMDRAEDYREENGGGFFSGFGCGGGYGVMNDYHYNMMGGYYGNI